MWSEFIDLITLSPSLGANNATSRKPSGYLVLKNLRRSDRNELKSETRRSKGAASKSEISISFFNKESNTLKELSLRAIVSSFLIELF